MVDNWKQVGWNGIRFKTPQPWEIGRLGPRHLILEDDTGPVMEVKWSPVKGHFSHGVHLKRLVASQSGKPKGRLAEWFLPPPWEKALAGYETRGFLWQSPNSSGRGAILFCPTCRNATLIQFFGDSSTKNEKRWLSVLRSFQDHRQDGRMFWSVFDIRAILPDSCALLHYRFEAGKYAIEFRDGRQHIHLQRWAPAAVILNGRDLTWFSRTLPEFAVGQPFQPKTDDSKTVEWSISPPGRWRRMICRLKAKPSYFWFRIWHLEDKNRILGVRAESKHPLDFQFLTQICAGYESL